MKQHTLCGELFTALILTGLTVAMLVLLPYFVGSSIAVVVTVAVGVAVYLLLLRRGAPSGKVVLPVCASAVVLASACILTVPAVVIAGCVAIWAVRSATRRAGLVWIAADALLSFGALAAAVAVYRSSGSTAVAVWSFFLVQALHVLAPSGARTRGGPQDSCDQEEKRFRQAKASAETALAQLV